MRIVVNGMQAFGKAVLDKLVERKVEELTGGLITCSGSEQGMQGDDYLSVDVDEAA